MNLRRVRAGSAVLTRALAGCMTGDSTVHRHALHDARWWPEYDGASVHPLARQVLPYRSQLWRLRAAHIAARVLTVAGCALLVMALIRHTWAPQAPVLICMLPALALLALACWLALAQRPPIAETARLLDRRFGLHDQLGTALEAQATPVAGSLVARQMAQAAAVAARLPHSAWSDAGVAPGHWWLNTIILGVAGVSLALPTSAALPPVPVTARPAVSYRTAAAAPIVAANGQPPVAQIPSRAQPAPRWTVPPPASATVRSSFAASLQVAAGPQLPAPLHAASRPLGSAQVAGSGAGQRSRHAARTGSAAQPAARGRSGAGAASPGSRATGSGRRPSGSTSDAGRSKGPTQGQPGAGSHTPPADQLGAPNTTDAQSGMPSSRGSTRRGRSGGSAQRGQSSQRDQPSQGGARSSANPFGQDTTTRSAGASGSSSAGQSGAAGGGHGTSGSNAGRGANRPRGNAQPRRSANGAGQQGSEDPQQRRGRASAFASADTGRPQQPTGVAGRAGGAQIDLGGHASTGGDGAAGASFQVAPLGAAPSSVPADSAAIGPSIVQGYLPEDDSQLSSTEQALIRAYFSNGGD